MTTQAKVLLTGFAPAEAEPYVSTLSDDGIEVIVETDPETARGRLADERFDTVIAAYPVAPGQIGSILSCLRNPCNESDRSGLVLLSAPESLRGASSLVGRGVSKVLSTAEDPAVLAIVVNRVVEESRVAMERLPIQAAVSCIFEDREETLTTENISGGGMLVATATPAEAGTRFRFLLELDNNTVSGQAKVVRCVTQKRETVKGFGARFLNFDGNGRALLLDALDAARQDQTTGQGSSGSAPARQAS